MRTTAAAAFALSIALCAREVASAASAPYVTTLAGNGHLGQSDGPLLESSFYIPSAVSVASDGTVYVADAGAQNIRRIREGRVETIAGHSDIQLGPDVRAGGYLDGPAKDAQFDRPIGLAVSKSGTLYVADAGNHCIRAIQNGRVSTFAGSTTTGSTDGTGSAASFTDLKGLAIDGDGNLYAADYGTGIRKISPRGEVTTLGVPSFNNTIVSVAARGKGNHLILAYADSLGIHIFAGGHDNAVRFDDQREPESSALLVGYADSLAILNDNTLALTDIATNAVRLLRMPAPPYVTDRMTRGLAGGIREGGDITGGFEDGPATQALVNAPLGVALGPDGSLVVADSGNRRIRKIAGVDGRESVLPDLSNFEGPPDTYRITLVGNSYLFYNVLWPESIPGRLESGLERDAQALGIPRRPYVSAFRIDGLTAAGQTSLISNYLADGQTDLVVLFVNFFNGSDSARLREIESRLQAAHTRFMLVYTPQGYQLSPLEYAKALVAEPNDDFATLHDNANTAEAFYASLGIRTLLLFDAMEQQEALPNRRSLFYGANHHLTVYGAEWVGNKLLDDIEHWSPWK